MLNVITSFYQFHRIFRKILQYTGIGKEILGSASVAVVSNVVWGQNQNFQGSFFEKGSRWSRALPTFDAESKSTKIPNSLCGGGAGEGGSGVQLQTFDAESKSAKIPNSLYGGGRSLGPNFQLLMPSINLIKSQFPYMVGRLGGGRAGAGAGTQLSTFDANYKSDKIPKSLYGGEGVRVQLPTFDAQSKYAKFQTF